MKYLPVAVSLLAVPAAHAQRNLKEIPPVNPEAQLESFQLAPGLEINLFAREPMIAKPIQMAWDDQGRLWVASSAIYPHIRPGQEQTDRILVLEDTDGDGVADRSTVFYEGLLIPTGILPGDGGAYVANSTELLFMRDTDGDRRADETRVLLSGFGTEDTHHILHSIRRGPDGCLYFAQSVYIHSHVETPYGVRRLGGSGFWQFRPETGRLEVYSMGQINPWGFVFDVWGQTFSTDGAYGEGINYLFPGATFRCLPDQLPRILKGLNPGQPKQCGLEIISGDHFPDDWQGSLITCDFRGHRVNRFSLKDQGSGYVSSQMPDVVTSTHGSFRPVDVKMGPDGALYLADWFNPIIQHGEVDFRDERRDHEHGRIWRITAKGRPLTPRIDFASESTVSLLRRLRDKAEYVRNEAKRALSARPGLLSELTGDAIAQAGAGLTPGSPEYDRYHLEVAWVLQNVAATRLEGIRRVTDAIGTLLKSENFHTRAAAVRIAGALLQTGALALEEHEEVARQVINDPHPRVRLEGINALRAAGTASAVELALLALDHEVDENIDFAAWLTCRNLADVWLPAFQNGSITFGGNLQHVAFALKAADRPDAAGALIALVSSGRISGPRVHEIVTLVGTLGNADDLAALVNLGSSPSGEGIRESILEALATAAGQRRLQPENGAEFVIRTLQSGSDAAKAAAATLAGIWKLEGARSLLEPMAAGGSVPALQAIAAIGGDASGSFLTGFIARAESDQAKADGLAALISLDPAAAAAKSAELLATGTDPAVAARLFDAWIARKDGAATLAAAIQGRKLDPAIATAGVQKASSSGGDNAALVEALTAAGDLQPVVSLTPDELAALISEVRSSGSAERGEAVYRREALQCQTCHAIGGAGGIVGPDLVSIGASAPVDYLIESLLEPSKKIKEGYATTLVTTTDGGVFSGFLARADDREVLLRDAAGNTQSIPASRVASRESVPVSLMPPALTSGLRRDEFVDLIRFMSELGKEGGLKIQEDGTVRRWRALHYSDQLPRYVNVHGYRGLLRDEPGLVWRPAYSLVNGELPPESAPDLKLWNVQQRTVYCEADVSAAGRIGLRLNDAAGTQVFVGEQEIPAATEMEAGVPAGRVRITLVLDTSVRSSPLRLQLRDLPGSPARVRPVTGP